MRLLSVLLILLFANILKAQGTYCNLELFSLKGETFIANINGNRLNSNVSSKVRAEQLSTDVVDVKIDFADKDLGTITKTLYLRMGQEERHVILANENQNKIDKWGNDMDNKILGALGVSQNERSSSNYVIRFSNSVPITNSTKIKVKKETHINTNKGTYHSKTEAE